MRSLSISQQICICDLSSIQLENKGVNEPPKYRSFIFLGSFEFLSGSFGSFVKMFLRFVFVRFGLRTRKRSVRLHPYLKKGQIMRM